jgi:hypothetical protein
MARSSEANAALILPSIAAGLPLSYISVGALSFLPEPGKQQRRESRNWWLFNARCMWLMRDGRADWFFP